MELTRLESRYPPGIPDVLCCSENGAFSFLELKVMHGSSRKVTLSPHQVSWQTRHGHASTFVVVRGSDLALRLYLGARSVDLRMVGIDAVPALAVFEAPYTAKNWRQFWRLTAPGGAV